MTNHLNEENKIAPSAYVFIGRSGSGKGTQVELFKKELEKHGHKILHVETGAFLREFVKIPSYTGERTKEVIESGGLMPESIVIGLWVNYLINNYTGKENIVCDGAPRKLAEAILLDGTFEFYKIPKYKVIHINTSAKWCTEKLLARARKDDTMEGIAKRMHWYDTEVMKSIEFFQNNKNCEVVDINGEQTIEQVHDELMKKVFNK